MNIEKNNTPSDLKEQPFKNREFREQNEASELKNNDKDIVKPDILYIETTSAKALFEQNRAAESNALAKADGKSDANETNRGGLTEDEKIKVKEKHPDWSGEIIDAIGSWEEYEIYDKVNLKQEYINGKPCLVRTDIDMGQTDIKGRTNRERMEQGLAPLDKNGRPIELHHIGQKADAPLVELTFEEHHQNGNDKILHDKNKETEVHGEGNKWDRERENHWDTRAGEASPFNGIAFTGSDIRDVDNYNYYKNEAKKHMDNSEYYKNEARKDVERANSWIKDDPSKSESFLRSSREKISKANSEVTAARDDSRRADSYK